MLICNPIQTKRYRIRKCLQKITERDLYASDVNFHSVNADVWAKKPHKCLWIREHWSAHTELSELQCLWVSWEAECHKQLGKQRSKPREREQEQRCCSAQLQWGTDYTHLRAGRVWNGNEEKTSLPHYPAATVNIALRQQGSRQHAAWTLFCFTIIHVGSEVHLIVTQEVPYSNETLRKNYFYLHILTLILRSPCMRRLWLVYSKQSKLSVLYTSPIRMGLETKYRLRCNAKASRARNSKGLTSKLQSKYAASFCSQACLKMPQVIVPTQPKIPVRKPNPPSLMHFSSLQTFKTSDT